MIASADLEAILFLLLRLAGKGCHAANPGRLGRFARLALRRRHHPGDEQEIKFADCPAAVRKALQAEAKGAKIETVTKENGDDEQTVYWAEVKLDDRLYAIGVLEDGTLSEMNLAVDDADLALDRLPGRRSDDLPRRVVRRKGRQPSART